MENAYTLTEKQIFFWALFIVVGVVVGVYGLHKYVLNADKNVNKTVAAPHPSYQKQEDAQFPSSPHVVDLKNDEEGNKILEANGNAKVVLVHAPWCGHCRNMMGDYVLAASTEKSVDWVRADGNLVTSLARRPDLKGFPTIYGVSESGEVSQHYGARDVKSLVNFALSLKKAKEPEKKETPRIEILPDE